MDAEECTLTYEVERKPLKAKTEAPKGRFKFGGFSCSISILCLAGKPFGTTLSQLGPQKGFSVVA